MVASSKMRKLLLCVSIGLNAIFAGGMFTFPLMSPVLAAQMKLSQPQLTSIVLAGMMSQYPVAVFVGSLLDKHGPSIGSLVAAVLFSSGFGAFSLEINHTPNNISHPSPLAFYRLTFYFLLVGLGTVFSYCSSLFAASKLFPGHIGLASGSSMALFGLSPLFLSVVATSFFTDSTTRLLNVSSFTFFLAALTSVVYLVGFINLRLVPWPAQSADQVESTPGVDRMPDEISTLLGSERATDGPLDPTVAELLVTPDFWLLGVFCIFVLGMSEMIISNIGTILISLPPASADSVPAKISSGSSTAFQVKVISMANTLSRLVVGPLADFVAPVSTGNARGVRSSSRKHIISRFFFLSSAAIILIFTFIWMEVVISDQSKVWVLSIGTGISYSTVFTILPTLISSLWGMQNLGRNFGVMMYAPFMGTPLFSYLYALISASHTEGGEGICQGRPCWALTFYLAIATSTIALLLSLILWKRWRDRI